MTRDPAPSRDPRPHGRVGLLDTLGREVRHAVRSLARSPSFTGITILTLALGIGATTGIFTLLDRVVLRPLPFPNEERLVWIESDVSGNATGRWGLSEAGYFYYRDNAHSLDGLGVYVASDQTPLVGREGAEVVSGAFVSAGLFDVLGLRATIGRRLTAEDDRPGGGDVAVLGHRFWMRRFNGDPRVIGTMLTIRGRPREIVGVLAPGANLPDASVDVWLPLNLDPAARPVNAHYLQAIGRLRPGLDASTAQRELAQLTARFPELFPSAYSTAFMQQYHFTPGVLPLRDHVVGGAKDRLWILLAAVGLVLVIACANVTNLFLVRLEARRRDAAIRTALGAGRGALAWHYLGESLLLALAAGALGLALAAGAIRVLLRLAPSSLPRLSEVQVGWEGAAFAAVVSLGAGVIFGLIPLLRRGVDITTLRESGRGLTASRPRQAARSALVVGQVGLALVLMAAAGLLLRSFQRLRAVQPGFDPNGVLAVDVSISSARYPTHEAAAAFYHELETRLGALPGVVSVGATQGLPLDDWGGCSVVFAQDKPLAPGEEPICVSTPKVTPTYFATMHIPVRGSTPTWSDVENHVSGVVVSRALAARLWPGEDPIGKGINSNGGTEAPYYRVVGVAGDVRAEDLQKPPVEEVYYPMVPLPKSFLWSPARGMTVVLRTTLANPADLTGAVRRVVRALDPEAPVANVRTMRQVVARSMARLSFTMLLLGVAAAMALVLSGVGLYGVVAYLVAQRRGEIGVRLALGAVPAQVGRLVVLQSVRLAVGGVALGLLGALAATRVLRSLLFGVSATDPVTLAGAALFLVAVAALASYAPARRAARVDPIEVLRGE